MLNNAPAPAFPGPVTPPEFRDALTRWRSRAHPVGADSLLAGIAVLGIVVPHADDETLGCGGLIAAAADREVAITVTILTDGAASHPGSTLWPARRLADQRRAEAQNAVALLTGGRGSVIFGNAPDGALSPHEHGHLAIPPANMLITCWQDDPHPDHKAAFAIAAARADQLSVPLLAFPLWTLTTDLPVPDRPVVRFDIGAGLARKQAALAVYESQLGQLVSDVDGFVLDAALQRLFVRPDELFVRIG